MSAKLNRILGLFSVMLLASVGCGNPDGDATPGSDAADNEFAADIYDDYIAGDDYLSWGTVPAEAAISQSADHSNAYVISYANDAAQAAMDDFQGTFPDGSILIKAQYEDAEGASLKAYTIMVKRDGYDEEIGDWFWAAISSDGTVSSAGNVSGCVNCHSSAADSTDWVRTEF